LPAVKKILLIQDEEAQALARRLTAKEGFLASASGAASVHHALEIAKMMPP
jgi:cysteine synthase A